MGEESMDRRSKIGLSALIVFWSLILLSLAWTKAPRQGAIASTGMTGTARFSHTATLLRNNQVLIAGGMQRNGVWLSSAELFDPASERFIVAGSMTAPRAGATATLLENGKVLIAGGATSPGASLSSAELFDPATGVFVATGSMSTARAHAVAVPLQDGKVLIAGGATAGDNQRTTSAELYDPVQGRFIPVGSMQTPRSANTAVRLKDGRVLVTGGMSYGDFPNPEIEASAEIYDPATRRFTPTGSMSVSRYKQGMALLPDGEVLVVGGQTGGSYGS